jgi:hypothetical protein
MMEKMVTVFVSYAHKDHNLRKELDKHLIQMKREGLISVWHDQDISPGTAWEQEIRTHLNTADIVLLLISPDFIASEYCYSVEMTRALERHEARQARVIPIILRPVDWSKAPFAHLQCLPRNTRPVANWRNRDQAFLEIAHGIRTALASLDVSSRPVVEPPATEPPKDFSATTLKDGQAVRANIPLEIKGTYSLKGSGLVWVVLEDDLGQYYHQNPPVRFLDNGEWMARNIIPGEGIKAVTFVHVGTEGDQVFQRKVAHNEWEAFSKLPPDHTILCTISIVVY